MVIVDDEALVRSGFQMILNVDPGIEVVGVSSGAGAVEVVETACPDVVLLDIRMPDVDGLTVLGGVCALPDPPVVAMLTTFDTDEYVIAALRAGAAGFLLKDTDPEQMAQLIRTLAAGGVVLSPRAATSLLEGAIDLSGSAASEAELARLETVTERERAVLVLVAEGLSNSEISQRIYLSIGTVKDHVSAILAKLGVNSRVQAALVAQRAGLLGGDVTKRR
ncbi:response regulator [Nocardia sp. NPDC058176]|uniref:response regulator n=1 Tax=Nocardia sp. NPDC058176 TaxID=3346368 RepID=UPI0036DA2C53